jgi:hypothetical protein
MAYLTLAVIDNAVTQNEWILMWNPILLQRGERKLQEKLALMAVVHPAGLEPATF